ncbi:MAG: DNA-binding protein WhiA [Clostridia bacterium]|nr:DNA-binding protein WhiA [Clostridia bacterium]
MSFSSEVKKELCSIEHSSDCCQRAEAYGILYYGRSFGKEEISLTTDYDYVAERYIDAIKCFTTYKPDTTISKSGKITVSVENAGSRLEIINELGYTGNERTMRLLTTNIENECCFGSFIRGVFLACGIITDPKKEYHLEFDVTFRSKSRDLADMFEDFPAIPKESHRNGVNLVYFKDSSHIEDILTVMGAQMSVMELIGEKILKDVRNNVNRKVNCDSANLRKTALAAANQTSAIEKLKSQGKFDDLPSDLKELAQLRIDNPEMTLAELGASLSKPLSRSGVSHRLKKLTEMIK